ncbi:hypothetical protein AB0F05_37265 [Streptomyces microflavus]|uniref:hypothetical protein n=1 Tax=Streptomyces microflavus TaxID=1919 RepID=UPI0033DC1289
MAHRLTHPSLLPAVPAQEIPRRPLSLGVHVQRIEIEDLVVTDHPGARSVTSQRVDASPGVDLLLAIGAEQPDLLLTGRTLRDHGRASQS